ncbi:MAG: sensor histidine kinase [Clostridiales bacterium]|nr:sensor histidine kinase [Clostridiales bacterium]
MCAVHGIIGAEVENVRKGTQNRNRSIEQQISRLLLTILPVMGAVIILLITTLFSINSRYTAVLLNANTAADFNKEFKSMLDAGMYNHVIRPRSEDSVGELPMEILDDAENVLRRLETTTTLPDNRWRIQSMLDMCENLRQYMRQIALEESYDQRMTLLERNIRGETGLTLLIETYMHDFIGDEVRELARIQGQIRAQVTVLSMVIVAGVLALSVVITMYSVRVTKRITGPISVLSRKAQQFGGGDFTPTPVDTHITELQTLDTGFNDMARRVDALMAKQMKDQRSLHRAELELLQAQINPHFLYNTLDSIAILAESDRGEDVVTMVTSLSTFFRNSLNKGQDLLTLGAECSQVTSYLEIQQIRYSDILRYEISVPQRLMDCMVPKLILQPLVENALYHGIKNRRGMGMITVTGEEKDGRLLLKVTDNGAGMDEEQVRVLQSGIYEDKHTGLGLVNVHKRIRLYCGEPYGLSFESEVGRGSTVSVLLPMTHQLGDKEVDPA